MKIIGFHVDGGFQEYIKLNKSNEANILKIPFSLESSKAVLSEPLACAVHQKKKIHSECASKVLIIGSGALGLLSAKLWDVSNAEETVLIDINPKKIKTASEIGQRAYIKDDFAKHFPKSYFDVALVCCPTNDGLKTGAEYLKKGGSLGFFSGLTEPLTETGALNEIHYKEHIVYGSYGCALSDTKYALDMLCRIDLPDWLITAVDLEEGVRCLEKIETDNLFTQIKYI
jgi:threonine dehydrogenase-like Zn-dependent dehydrogenase